MAGDALDKTVVLHRAKYNRRQALMFGAGAISGVVGTMAYSSEGWGESTDAAGGEGPPPDYEQTFGGDFVSKIVFDGTGSMVITFADGHGAEAFGVWHVSDNEGQRQPIADYEMSPFGQEGNMPRYGGTVNFELIPQLADSGTSFPSNEFKLIGGVFRPRWEVTGRVRFVVPEDLMPEITN